MYLVKIEQPDDVSNSTALQMAVNCNKRYNPENICKARASGEKLARLCLAVQSKELEKGGRPIFLKCEGKKIRLAKKFVKVEVVVSRNVFVKAQRERRCKSCKVAKMYLVKMNKIRSSAGSLMSWF